MGVLCEDLFLFFLDKFLVKALHESLQVVFRCIELGLLVGKIGSQVPVAGTDDLFLVNFEDGRRLNFFIGLNKLRHSQLLNRIWDLNFGNKFMGNSHRITHDNETSSEMVKNKDDIHFDQGDFIREIEGNI